MTQSYIPVFGGRENEVEPSEGQKRLAAVTGHHSWRDSTTLGLKKECIQDN